MCNKISKNILTIALESISIVKLVKCVSGYTQNKKILFVSIPIVDIQNLIFTFLLFSLASALLRQV